MGNNFGIYELTKVAEITANKAMKFGFITGALSVAVGSIGGIIINEILKNKDVSKKEKES